MNPYFALSIQEWVGLALGSIVFGLSRTSLRGASFLAIPIFIEVFGGRASAGVVLVLFVLGDLVAIRRYRRDVNWFHVRALMPWTILGVVLGTLTGRLVPDSVFVRIMAVIILISTMLLGYREKREIKSPLSVPPIVSGLLGILAGFASMIGNAAGSLMNLYFLSRGLSKDGFIGTVAWFFFIINVIKVPFHVFAWRTITMQTLGLGFILLPAILIGAFLGIRLARIVPERPFRIMILILVTIASVRLLIV